MSKLDVLDGHNIVDPAYVGNTSGKWLCDGWTAYQWMMHCATLTRQGNRSREGEEAAAISGALQSMDNEEATP